MINNKYHIKCPLCWGIREVSLSTAYTASKGITQGHCRICDNILQSKKMMDVHGKLPKNRIITCAACGEKFAVRVSYLYCQIKKHGNINLWECTDCRIAAGEY